VQPPRRTIPIVRVWRRSIGAVVSGVREDPDFRSLTLVALSLLISGTVFYMVAEGWSFVDAFYFSTIILTTIGLGETPDSDLAKLFTSVYALVGIGVLIAFGTAFAQRLVDVSQAEQQQEQDR
jgi:voltage-gated potassium channel